MGRAQHVFRLNKKKLVIVINNEPILSSMLAAGIVQDTFAGEAGEGEREAKWRRLEATSTTRAGNSSRFVAIEFLSQITNTHMCIRNVRTYTYIDDYGGGLASLLNFYRKSLTRACVLETYVCIHTYIYQNLDLDD